MNHPGSILILGAGATGLGAAYRLKQLDLANWRVLEKQQYAGGLASSFLDGHGFTWDSGGHVQFSHYKEYDHMLDLILGEERLCHERRSWIWLNGKAIPYPLQYNLHNLDDCDRQRALSTMEAARSRNLEQATPPKNFRAWIDRTFGSWIADHFMVPYNTKVWGYPLELLSTSWVAERVAVPNLDRARQHFKPASENENWGPNKNFWYPRQGGTGLTWRRLAATLGDKIELGVSISSINLGCHNVVLSDGRVLQWDTLVSSLPLDVFCRLCSDLDLGLRQAVNRLMHSSCHIIGIGLRGDPPDSLRRSSWIYFPGPESPYYRVTVLSNYSPNNAPPGCWSLLAEVCETPYRPFKTDNLSEEVVSSLERDHLIPHGAEVMTLWYRREEHGYPTPSIERDTILDLVLPALERYKVYSRGRFGAWKYEVSNQDHSFMQGFELINRLFGLGQEVTLLTPDVVNQPR